MNDVTHDCLKMTNSAFQSGDGLLNHVSALAIHLLTWVAKAEIEFNSQFPPWKVELVNRCVTLVTWMIFWIWTPKSSTFFTSLLDFGKMTMVNLKFRFFIPMIYLAKNLRKNLILNTCKNHPQFLHKSAPTYPQTFHIRLRLSTGAW